MRRFSPEEILRLLCFPPAFRLPESLTLRKAWEFVGNSLSLAAVRHVLAAIPELAELGLGNPCSGVHRPRSVGVGRGPAVYAAVLAAVFAFGFWRLNLVPASDATIRVAGITAGHGQDLGKAVDEAPNREAANLAIEAHREAYFRATAREAEAGAQVVVWPEVAGAGYAASEAGFIDPRRSGRRRARHLPGRAALHLRR